MLIIALILAALLYVVLYFVWTATASHLQAPSSTLMMLRDLIFSMPPLVPLAILKWAIIIMALYLIADALISPLKRKRRKAADRETWPASNKGPDKPEP